MGKIFSRHPYYCLFLICFFAYGLSLFYLPTTDRDEGRFVQATKQMLESNDYLTIKFQDEFRNKKPAGIYWLQALSVKLSGQSWNTVWPYRLPSLFCAILAVLLTYYFASRLFGDAIARTSALFMASSTVLIVEATTAKTDSALLLATLSATGLLALGYQDTQKRILRSLLLGLSLALGAMIKGPLVFFFFTSALLTLWVMDKNKQWLKNFHWSVILFIPIATVLPWFLMIQKATGGQFAQDSLGSDFSKKILSAQEGHGAPPGFFTMSLFIGLWSSVLWLLPSFKKAWSQKNGHRSLLFCISATITAFVILEFIPTKLIHYPLPLYPWLTMIAAWGFHQPSDFRKSSKWNSYLFLIISFLISGAFLVITFLVDGTMGAFIIAGLLGAILLAGAIISFKKRSPYTIIAALISFPTALTTWLPHLSSLWVTENIYKELAHDRISPILLMGYGEPSAVFRLGTSIIMSKKPDALTRFLKNSCGHIFVDEKLITKEIAQILELSSKVRFVREITGINYNKGSPMRLKHYAIQ